MARTNLTRGTRFHRLATLALASLLALFTQSASAQEAPPPDIPTPPSEVQQLRERQLQIAARYKRFEEVLLRMAEITASDDPQRAALLRQAVARSKKQLISVQFDRLSESLDREQLAAAVSTQEDLTRDLKSLLELLLNEDRAKRLESEQERVREYLKQVNKLIKEQQGIQGQTRRAQSGEQQIAERQDKLAGQTGDLAERVKQESQAAQESEADEGESSESEKESSGESKQGESSEGESKEGESKEGESSSGESKEGQSKEGESKAGESSESESKEGEAKESPESQSGEPGESKEGESKSGEQSESQPGKPQSGEPQQGGEQGESQQGEQSEQESQEQAQSTNPVQERLKAAQERMQKATERLKKAEQEQAVEEQRKALEELEQAKADLEKILRQLREEELARVLAYLEARFRKMLEEQQKVHTATTRLVSLPEAERGRSVEIEAGRLGRQESQIAIEADKALTLLREDGTAVAMPEAVLQLRDDMRTVATRLGEFKVDPLTVGLEEDIIAGLEDILAALEKAKQDLEKQQQQESPQQPPAGEPQEPPLVDNLAELKMIRALQMRINRRTETYSKMIDGEQAVQADLLAALAELAQRQERIYRTTKDIAVGRNR